MADFYFDVDAALGEVPVNLMPLIDDTDFKTREVAVAYNAAGMDLVWNFVTSDGAFTQTAVTPTTAGAYDWTHQGDGIYTIEIPASGGASINNDTEGYGWFSGIATGVLPWRGPTIGFRAAALNDSLLDTNTTGLLAPTVAARTLDVSATGEAGIDWANIGSPTTAVNLSATNIDVDQVVASVSGAVGSVTGNVGGNVTGSVGTVNALAANVITAAATAADFTTEIQAGLSTLDAAGVRTAVGLATANLDTQLSAINSKTTNLPTDPADESLIIAATDAIMTRLGAPAGASVSADVAAVKSQTAAIEADTTVIGATGAGLTALASAANLATLTGYVDTEVAAIKAKTDQLAFGAANTVNANITHVIADPVQANGSTTTNWGGTP